jgi:hypothetical protein
MTTPDAETIGDLIVELAKISRIAHTPRRDSFPADLEWLREHPFRKAFATRGIITAGVAAAAVIEWLEILLADTDPEPPFIGPGPHPVATS